MTDNQILLEKMLRDQFGCKKPFLEKPVPLNYAYHKRCLTRSGEKAYSKLISALQHLEADFGFELEDCIEFLDDVVIGLE